jgi:hypothetical protein
MYLTPTPPLRSHSLCVNVNVDVNVNVSGGAWIPKPKMMAAFHAHDRSQFMDSWTS